MNTTKWLRSMILRFWKLKRKILKTKIINKLLYFNFQKCLCTFSVGTIRAAANQMFGQKANISLGEISNQSWEHKLNTENKTSNIDSDAINNQSKIIQNPESNLVSFTMTLVPELNESSDFYEIPSVLTPGEQQEGNKSVLPSTHTKSTMSRMSNDLRVSVTSFCRYQVLNYPRV